MAKKKNLKTGRPKKTPSNNEVVNEQSVEVLKMENKDKVNLSNTFQNVISLDNISNEWRSTFNKIQQLSEQNLKNDGALQTTMSKWNALNPFLQNERLKNLTSSPNNYTKEQMVDFLSNPGNNESQLRSISWNNSSNQQLYYNILRKSCDIPLYNYYVVPEYFEDLKKYKKDGFISENKLINDWLENLNVKNTFKTIALQVKREGKQSYLLRNKISGCKKERKVEYAALQKLPTEWIKVTGIGQLGYTISFNMMYFMNPANDSQFYGEYLHSAWLDIINKKIIVRDERNNMKFDYKQAMGYKYVYNGENMNSMFQSNSSVKGGTTYMFWLQMPFDICYTFGSDNSHPWVAPDTMGTLMKLQELTNYGKLAGLIASTPLTAILTGEAEYTEGARAGMTETKIAPEVLRGLQDLFNATTSTNIEAMFFPLKNIKLQQLSTDVNSSEILKSATENFIEMAGESGLTITSDKPNVSQIKTTQMLAASQQEYVTIQFENALNYIIQHKLGMEYNWKIKIWGDIFSKDSDKKYLKEVVANGNIALLPKLMSAEGISMLDTKAMVEYIKQLDFYKDFQTYTMIKSNELAIKNSKITSPDNSSEGSTDGDGAGRPALDDTDVNNDSTAKSKDDGTNTVDNRDTMSKKCPLCGEDLDEEDQEICDNCRQRILDEN